MNKKILVIEDEIQVCSNIEQILILLLQIKYDSLRIVIAAI